MTSIPDDIQSELTSIGNSTAAIRTAIVAKGVTPTGGLSSYADAISSMSGNRNIGEIITSTIPLVDAGLHLLDGALISGSSSYSAFVNYIAELYNIPEELLPWNYNGHTIYTLPIEDDPLTLSSKLYNIDGTEYRGSDFVIRQSGDYGTEYKPFYLNNVCDPDATYDLETGWVYNTITVPKPAYFCTEAQWQSSVTTYGVCGKFVYSISSIRSTVPVGGDPMTLSGSRNASSDMDAGSLGMRYAWYVPELNGDIFTTTTSPSVGDDIWIYENSTWSTTYMGMEPKVGEIIGSVRLPKITGIIEGTTDVTALGDLVQAGLPNITGTLQGMVDGIGGAAGLNMSLGTGAFSVSTERKSGSIYYAFNSAHGEDGNYAVFDASNSSSVYGNSTTVQPQAIKAFYYIVIATSAKTDIQVDIDEIATDLNGKADVDLTNINNTAKGAIVHNAMPSATYEDLTLGTSGAAYTAPADGWVFLYGSLESSHDRGFGLLLNGTTGYRAMSTMVWLNYGNIVCWLPVNKGDSFNVLYQYYVNDTFRFYYANGNESEAQ